MESPLHLDPTHLAKCVSSFDGQPVLVVGDVMLDRYVWGDTRRISPEAPVPVIDAREETARLGGAANVAHNVHALGGRVRLLGVRGADGYGVDLENLLRERGVSPEDLVVDPARRTTVKTRVVARNQQVVRVDREDVRDVDGGVHDELRARLSDALRESRVCILSDYGKGVLSASILDAVIAEAAKLDVPVCVDPKETHFFRYRGAATLTPNQYEAGTVYGQSLHDEHMLIEAGRSLVERLGARSLLVTRGEKGMVLFRPDHPPLAFPAIAREVFDVTGAGDTVVSVFALALAAGGDLPEAAAIANHAAGLVVREVGTAVATRAGILDSLRQPGSLWQPVALGNGHPGMSTGGERAR